MQLLPLQKILVYEDEEQPVTVFFSTKSATFSDDMSIENNLLCTHRQYINFSIIKK